MIIYDILLSDSPESTLVSFPEPTSGTPQESDSPSEDSTTGVTSSSSDVLSSEAVSYTFILIVIGEIMINLLSRYLRCFS
jgi:hypothetical protein